jgi:hypothetical protein
MTKEELSLISGTSYSWIKVKSYTEKEFDVNTPSSVIKDEYELLLEHHKKETQFLIDKCRELAKLSRI